MSDQRSNRSGTSRFPAQAVRTDQLLGIDQVLVSMGGAPPTAQGHPAREINPAAGIGSDSISTSASVLPAPPIELPEGALSVDRLACLQAIHEEQCPHCTQSTTHQHIVFGEGDPEAELMFVGEAPGAEEDRTGRPFVGRAGAKLDEMIVAMGFRREEVYIANVLKTRPPDNRTPLQHEVEACGPYLAAQVRVVAPKAIVALGGPAAKLLLKTETGITRLRGKWGVYESGEGPVPVMATFHPAYLLRNPTLEVRGQVWEDLKAVLARLGRDVPG